MPPTSRVAVFMSRFLPHRSVVLDLHVDAALRRFGSTVLLSLVFPQQQEDLSASDDVACSLWSSRMAAGAGSVFASAATAPPQQPPMGAWPDVVEAFGSVVVTAIVYSFISHRCP